MNTIALVLYVVCLVAVITGLFVDLIIIRTSNISLSSIAVKYPAVAVVFLVVNVMIPVCLALHLFLPEWD